MAEDKKSCYNCAYKRSVPGSAHISCSYKWMDSDNKQPKADQHGIDNGWYIFPFNYDPVWQQEECPSFSTQVDPKMVTKDDPMFNLIALLGGR